MKILFVTRTGKLLLADWFKHRELKALGHQVTVMAHFRRDPTIFEHKPDLILCGKPEIACVRWMREHSKAPIIVWHQDWTDWSAERRAWGDELYPLVDYLFVCETDVVARYGHARLQMSGLNYEQAPTHVQPVSKQSKTIFAGNLVTADLDPIRRGVVAELTPQLVVGEPVRAWNLAGFRARSPVDQTRMADLYNGNVGIAFQRRPEMQHCFSNRSLLISGGGGLLYAQRFQDYEQFIAEDEAIWFDKPQPYVYSPDHQEVQLRGFQRMWRDYSWPVVVRQVMDQLV